MAQYNLMNAKNHVLTFSHEYTDIGDQYAAIAVLMPDLLPIDLRRGEVTTARLGDWVERRVIPVNRRHMEAVLSAINLHDNPFDEALGWIAFTGHPSDILRHLSTPEITTEGMLPKYWHRISTNDIILCKGGTEGYSNTIPYHLERRSEKPVSISRLFTTKNNDCCYLLLMI